MFLPPQETTEYHSDGTQMKTQKSRRRLALPLLLGGLGGTGLGFWMVHSAKSSLHHERKSVATADDALPAFGLSYAGQY